MKFLSLMQSVIAAAFGVQSLNKYKEDYETGNPVHFIAAGFVFTALLVGVIIFIVHRLV